MDILQINKLNKELKEAEQKKLLAQKEEKAAYDEKMRHINELSALKKSIENAKGIYDKNSVILTTLKKDIENKKKELSELKQMIDELSDKITNQHLEYDENKAAMDKIVANAKKESIAAQTKYKAALQIEQDALKLKNSYEKSIQALVEQQQQLSQDKKDVIEMARKVSTEAKQVQENTEKLNQLKLVYDKKLDELLKEKSKIATANDSFHQKEVSFNAIKEQFLKKEAELNIKIADTEKARKNHERALRELDKNKEELRIKQLRVDKIVRDKDISAELKLLEEAAK